MYQTQKYLYSDIQYYSGDNVFDDGFENHIQAIPTRQSGSVGTDNYGSYEIDFQQDKQLLTIQLPPFMT